MDRASAFSDDETIQLLKTRYVPIGVSVTELKKSQDTAGDFFRKIIDQRAEPRHSKQGYYICSPDGALIKGWMYPRPDDGTMKRYLRDALKTYQPPKQVEPLDERKVDRQCNPQTPDGTIVVDVFSKITRAKWGPSPAERCTMVREVVGHDRLWITKAEGQAIVRGGFPDSLLERIIRFHLVDNTRGVPARWKQEEVEQVRITLTPEKGRARVEAHARMKAGDERGYETALFGTIETKGDSIARFDLVARGEHWAKDVHAGEVPIGKCTLAIAFSLAPAAEDVRVPPLYTYDLADYMRTDKLRVTELRRKPNGE